MRSVGHIEALASSRRLQSFASIRYISGTGRELKPRRDSYDFSGLLQRCSSIRNLKQVHAQIITSGYEQNQFLAANIVSLYASQSPSSTEEARKVFDSVRERDVFLWNVLIRGYAHSGPFSQALCAYNEMRYSDVRANRYTYPFLLKACAAVGDETNGQTIHVNTVKIGLDSDVFVANALLAFYAKCGKLELGRKVFDEMPSRDVVTWNSMISGYAQNQRGNESLRLFHQMLRMDLAPDHATLVGVLPACGQEAAIQEGMWIHCYVIKSGMQVCAALGSGLIAMYANCGRLDTARDLFNRVPERNVIVWNVMIRCYGMHGQVNYALEMFSQMLESGICPDGISFVCVLSACSHGGLLDEGWTLFEKMDDYGVQKSEEHYACIVDLLGRAGKLDESVEFVRTMPVKAGKEVYGALLGACRIHNNIVLAEEVAQRLFILDPENAGRYILLAKMYEDLGQWEDAARVRKLVREKQIKKPLGCSSIEVDCVLHTFGVEDESHPMKEQIFGTLEQMEKVIEMELLALQS